MVIGIDKIWIPVAMVYLIANFIKSFVALREKWHNGSRAKYEAEKAKLEARYMEQLLKEGDHRIKLTYRRSPASPLAPPTPLKKDSRKTVSP